MEDIVELDPEIQWLRISIAPVSIFVEHIHGALFNINDGISEFDHEGTECATLEVGRAQALRVLPEMARDQALEAHDRVTYTVLATDEDHRPVYSATLSLVGLWLIR